MARYIQRHSLFKRVTHGIVAVSCFVLVLTGFVVFVPAIAAAVGTEIVNLLKLGHRIFAVTFIGAPLVGLILFPKGFVHMVGNYLEKWDDDDKEFMKKFVPYLFMPKKVHMPDQQEVKSGQRLADAALLIVSLTIALSGIVLWAGKFVSAGVFAAALLVHDISFFGFAIIMLAHVYLGAGVFQPYRGLARLMFGDGMVPEGPALYHWGHWAKAELASGKNVVEK